MGSVGRAVASWWAIALCWAAAYNAAARAAVPRGGDFHHDGATRGGPFPRGTILPPDGATSGGPFPHGTVLPRDGATCGGPFFRGVVLPHGCIPHGGRLSRGSALPCGGVPSRCGALSVRHHLLPPRQGYPSRHPHRITSRPDGRLGLGYSTTCRCPCLSGVRLSSDIIVFSGPSSWGRPRATSREPARHADPR